MKGSSLSTGPQEGLGAGTGKKGTPEATNFDRKSQLHPRELSPGEIAGVLPGDEESPAGEARLPVSTVSRADLEAMAEKVDNEVLPAEYREQIRLYMESLQQPASSGSGSGSGSGSESGRESGSKTEEK